MLAKIKHKMKMRYSWVTSETDTKSLEVIIIPTTDANKVSPIPIL